MMINLIDKLKVWDGVHIEYLTKLYNAEKTNTYFFENLITICTIDKDLQKASTWLIKHHYDKGNTLPILDNDNLLNICTTLKNWEAKLHLLQLLPHFRLTDKTITIVDDFTRSCLTDNINL